MSKSLRFELYFLVHMYNYNQNKLQLQKIHCGCAPEVYALWFWPMCSTTF